MPGYRLEGSFIEACDCYTVCPCWVDDDPDEGHCTGLIAWVLDPGSEIDGVDVSGCTVVSVSTHVGNRRVTGTATVLFVDEEASKKQFKALRQAFAGRLSGPLAGLATVSGEVIAEEQARITITERRARWSVEVVRDGGSSAVRASGTPRVFEDATRPLVLQATALSPELGVPEEPAESAGVTAQAGEGLTVRVGELPGGFVQVTGRSGMRGRFGYAHPRRPAVRAGEKVAAGNGRG
ncbi:DUF1326 domain-containing protein [Actinomycetospora atypica]|uniref:DUF1326 domain-containing protein n=1 Tax=Actinomycetospora atypica TaxID=1290095 RepID=A0ABV9YNG2_9PSEU